MKILYILAIAITIFFGLADLYYIEAYQEFQGGDSYYDYMTIPDDEFDASRQRMLLVTREGAIVSALFIVFYLFTFSFTLALLKRKTAKILSIIGLCASALCFAWCFLPITTPGHVDFGEFGPGLFIYILAMLAFCIANLVQATRPAGLRMPNPNTIDDIR